MILGVISFISCNDEIKHEEKIIAQVGKSKLTEEQLELSLKRIGNGKFRDEFIREWVSNEVLLQEASKHNLLKDDNFTSVLNETRQQLAASLAINNYLRMVKINLKDSELKEFFETNKDEYIFPVDIYIINKVLFDDLDNAIAFRKVAIFDDWKSAENNFKDNEAILNISSKRLVKLSDIQSKRTIRIIKLLGRNEISPVIETEHNNFAIVQLIDKIEKGKVPKYDFIKSRVIDTYLQIKQRELIKEYVDSLLANSNVKIY